ncbi:CinA family protein [Cnuibacter sp. UC19_7]|uniref:CinA family protein n=1 Tax=Cnuibacter sp. UC19_7 TaxID=3350166 RepID=UPI0036724BDF
MSTAARLVAMLTASHTSLAVAESLTGGMLAAEIVSVPGASAVFRGGVVAYATPVKHSLLGVAAETLAAHGAVHPDVAMQMASGVREALQIGGEAAAIGLATTGAAGPDPQDGQPPGTVFIGVAIGSDVRAVAARFDGDRESVRRQTTERALALLEELLTA